MLIDYIDQEKLPWIIIWLDWNFANFNTSLSVLIGITAAVVSTRHHLDFDMMSLSVFVAICAWVTYCAARYGFAVG